MPLVALTLFLLLATPIAHAASAVVKSGKNTLTIWQDKASPFKVGDFVCVQRKGKAIACGDVTQLSGNTVSVKVTLRKRGLEAVAGDPVLPKKRPPTATDEPVPAPARVLASPPPQSQVTAVKAAVTTDEGSVFALSAEGLGAGLLYSVFLSYRVNSMLVLNFGGSFSPLSDATGTGASASALTIPVSLSALLFGKEHFVEVMSGGAASFVNGTGSFLGTYFGGSTGSSIMFIPEFGLGYRYWPKDGGFLFRAMAYGLIVPSVTVSSTDPGTLITTQSRTGGLVFTGGLSVGYAF